MKTKRIMALLAAMLMGISVIGCGSKTVDSTSADTNKQSSSDSQSEEVGAINFDEDPYEVAIQVVILPGQTVEDEEEIESAINEITLPAINCTVDIQYVWISEIVNTTSLGVASDEKLDILHVATLNKLSTLVGSEILYDMNEGNLLQNRGQQLIETFGDYIDAGNVNGQQLAVPALIYMAQQCAFYYNKTLTDSLGITVPEQCSMDDLEQILVEIHKDNPDVMPYFVGQGTTNLMSWMMNCEGFGSNYSYGGIIDFMNSTKIENIYATDAFKDYCLRMYHWRQDGLIQRDATDTNASADYFNAGQLAVNLDIYTPTEFASVAASAAANNIEIGCATLDTPAVTNSIVAEYMWGIASNSKRPDKAMDFLNFLYSNADVANLLMYGIEGKDYIKVEGKDNLVSRTGTYSPSFYKGGDVRQMFICEPNDENYVEECDALENSAEKSPIIGYVFSDADYQTEAGLISNVINEYLPTLQNGMFDSEDAVLESIDEFVAALESAGINDVIAGNQEQLDAFMASK